MEEIRLNPELVASLCGVVRLLRRAGQLTWARVQSEGVGSYQIFTALAIDQVADQTAYLLPARTTLSGPEPLGDSVVALLRSARELAELGNAAEPQQPLARLEAQISELISQVDEPSQAE